METSQNLAAQIVNNACEGFQQFVDQQAALAPMAQKNSKQLKIWIKINKFAIALLFLSIIVWVLSSIIRWDKKTFMLEMNITLGILALTTITILVSFYCYGKEQLYRRTSNKIAAGRLSHVKNSINRALMAHMCVNEDDYTTDFYFRRMQQITGGFFADDFESQLEPEEASEIRNWLRTSYSGCLRAD